MSTYSDAKAMAQPSDPIRIDESRLLADIESLAQVGRTPEGGVSRPAMSEADMEGRAWFRARVEAAGLEFRQDGAGNISAILSAADPSAPTLLTGSHLDTVPNGGRFDGALGVLAGLEALRTVRESGLHLPVHLEVISFTDEEGHLLSVFGSRAFTGQLEPGDLAQARGGRKELEEGMRRLGITEQSILAARRDPKGLLAFVELHVEQGSRLEDENADIGIVSAIVGIRSYWLRFLGQAAHAGTTSMLNRADAARGMAQFILGAHDLVMDRFSPGVINCGNLSLLPGAFNVVPAVADVALEFRHRAEDQLDEMEQEIFRLARAAAHANRLSLEVQPAIQVPAASMDARIISASEKAAARQGLSYKQVLSFAGHDAQAISSVMPSGMIFVPSARGVSHTPDEFTRAQSVADGANVLLGTLLELLSQQTRPLFDQQARAHE